MKQKLFLLIPLTIIGILCLAFFALFERETFNFETIDAVDDDFQVAKQLLRAHGFEVLELDNYLDIQEAELPFVLFALHLPQDLDTLSEVNELNESSHLIAMNRFKEFSMGNSGEQDAKELFFKGSLFELEERFSSTLLLNHKGVATFPDYPNLQLKLKGVYRFRDDQGQVGFSIHIDDGGSRTTLLADSSFMSNQGLADADNAAYLIQLSTSLASHPTIYFLEKNPAETPHLLTLIWQKGKSVVLAFFACVLVFLWMRIPRLGPTLPDPPLGRRSLREHIFGTAKFHWRMGHQAKLLEVARFDVLERIRKLRPDWVGLEAQHLHQRVADHAKLRMDQVALALGNSTDAESFQSVLTYLQMIRRSL